jgi:hypothetical protein
MFGTLDPVPQRVPPREARAGSGTPFPLTGWPYAHSFMRGCGPSFDSVFLGYYLLRRNRFKVNNIVSLMRQ